MSYNDIFDLPNCELDSDSHVQDFYTLKGYAQRDAMKIEIENSGRWFLFATDEEMVIKAKMYAHINAADYHYYMRAPVRAECELRGINWENLIPNY